MSNQKLKSRAKTYVGNSSSDEPENQFQSLRTASLNPKVETQHASPSPSERTIESRPSKIPVLQKRSTRTSDVPQTTQHNHQN